MWFKLNLHQKPLIDAVPDETAGKALKAAMAYFQNREQIELDPLATAVFSMLKASADEALDDYAKAVADGKKGGRPMVTDGIPPLPTPTEEDIDIDKDKEEKKIGNKSDGADKPPSRPRFSPPSVEEVQDYCFEKGLSMDAQRFVDYYESNGWMVGRNKMKDWKAAIRGWEAREKTQKPNNGGYVHGADRLAEMIRNGEFDD